MFNSIPYGRQHIDQTDIDAVIKTLQSDYLTQGPAIESFELAFAEYIGAKHAIAVSNGTAALHLAALALGAEKKRVITSPITFAASANCIEYCGGEVFFCDIDPKTLLMDLEKLESLLNTHPSGYFSGIVPVEFAGLSVDLEKLKSLAEKHGLWIIEDACHAPGARFSDSKGQEHKAGNGKYADCTIFSFHPVKHIACGEGGMVTTNDDVLADKIKLLRTHGITKSPELMGKNDGGWYYEMIELGYNYRLTDIQAALGESQLRKLDDSLNRRNTIALNYRKAFENYSITIQDVPSNQFHAYHLFIVQVADRKGLYEHLRENKIFAQVHYIPVHLHPYYQAKGWKKGDMPSAEAYYDQCLSLPMYPTLTNEEQEYVIQKVVEFLDNSAN
ncbi:MAG: UDP-4-amino-4,6-dideoxy-N-acetyl-beta-L-altrosamine transaminase [Bacteroidetes bacterium]|nr:UDP-4-amino-4,6-dideoxy-N-acetyl-beta-L-altrosamine transaminase [Bacteroidota bacterium]